MFLDDDDEFAPERIEKQISYLKDGYDISYCSYFSFYFFGIDAFYNDGIAVLQIPMEEYGIGLSSARLINNARKHNIATHYWTINNEEDMITLIENGADAIMTDYPHKLKNVLDSYR